MAVGTPAGPAIVEKMPNRQVLLVLDLLNDIVHPEGKYAPHGYARQVAENRVLENTATALDRARAAHIPVVYVIVGFSANYAEWPANSPVFAEARPEGKLIIGSWATQVHDMVKPTEGEQIVTKRRISPFYGTDLDLILRTREIDSLLVTGVSTDLVVLATARDGHDRDFRVTVLSDACASANRELHESALTLISRTATVATVAEVLSV
jgi:nicotinamidase-related amidase